MPAFLIGSLGVTGSTLIGALILDFIIQWVHTVSLNFEIAYKPSWRECRAFQT